jgi:hypothetical protein
MYLHEKNTLKKNFYMKHLLKSHYDDKLGFQEKRKEKQGLICESLSKLKMNL